MKNRSALCPEPCGDCVDTWLRKTGRVLICVRCGEPARLCVRCLEMRAEYGVRPAETCARCNIESEMAAANAWGPS